MLTVVRREVYPMDMKILFILLVLLFLPTSAGPGGPLDGAWHDQSGNTIVVRSEVVHATVWFQSSDGRSETVRARYTGYTALDFQGEGVSWGTIQMVRGGRLQVVGGGWDGLYSR